MNHQIYNISYISIKSKMKETFYEQYQDLQIGRSIKKIMILDLLITLENFVN